MLSDTLRRVTVTLTNRGKARVDYSWAWLRPDGPGAAAPAQSLSGPGALDGPEPSAATVGSGVAARLAIAQSARVGGGSISAGSSKAPQLSSSAFDLLPIRGSLGAGESESAEVSFYAYPGCRAAAVAVCHVAGGPDYQVGGQGPILCGDEFAGRALAWVALHEFAALWSRRT